MLAWRVVVGRGKVLEVAPGVIVEAGQKLAVPAVLSMHFEWSLNVPATKMQDWYYDLLKS